MLCLAMLAMMLVSWADAQETESQQVGNKSQCVREMVQWCNNMQYSPNNTGSTVRSISLMDSNSYLRILCFSDSEGTNCSKNGSPWFACAPDHTLRYKGQIMTDASTDVDDDICNTTNTAFNELSIQTMLPNSTDLMPDLQGMFEAMDEMQAMFRAFERQMSTFNRDFTNIFSGNFPFQEYEGFEPDDSRETSTEDSNQIERE